MIRLFLSLLQGEEYDEKWSDDRLNSVHCKESEGRSYSNPGIDGYDVKKTTNGGSNSDGLTREKEMSVDCPKTQTSIVTDNPSLGTIALFSGGGTEEEGHLPCHRFVDQKKYNVGI